jgi:hypothetical protein
MMRFAHLSDKDIVCINPRYNTKNLCLSTGPKCQSSAKLSFETCDPFAPDQQFVVHFRRHMYRDNKTVVSFTPRHCPAFSLDVAVSGDATPDKFGQQVQLIGTNYQNENQEFIVDFVASEREAANHATGDGVYFTFRSTRNRDFVLDVNDNGQELKLITHPSNDCSQQQFQLVKLPNERDLMAAKNARLETTVDFLQFVMILLVIAFVPVAFFIHHLKKEIRDIKEDLMNDVVKDFVKVNNFNNLRNELTKVQDDVLTLQRK